MGKVTEQLDFIGDSKFSILNEIYAQRSSWVSSKLV